MFYEVIPTEVFRNGGGVLTYSSDTQLTPGQVVLVPLGRKTVLGIVWKRVKSVDFPTKPIIKVICPFPVPSHLLKSIFWLSRYYLTSIPLVANLMIPAGLAAKNALKGYSDAPEAISTPNCPPDQAKSQSSLTKPLKQSKSTSQLKIPLIPLNSAQKQALSALQHSPSTTSLLRGVTGSGKTNIYLQLTSEALQQHRSTILLVPEIALTSQLVKIFTETFGDRVVLIHSQQTMAERRRIWLDITTRTGHFSNSSDTVISDEIQNENSKPSTTPKGDANIDEVQGRPEQRTEPYLGYGEGAAAGSNAAIRDSSESLIIIGPRSALLSPLHNLGLILIDEAHEGAYYQENQPRYSALRLASFIAHTEKIPCIFGTATPNIVDYHLAKSKNTLVELSQKAKTTAIDSKITVIDFKNRELFSKNRYFSAPLLTAIEKNIQDNHQTLIFHNRRGSAPVTMCEECGWQALCPECFMPMTLHTDTYQLSCHICGHEEKVPSSCPSCHHTGIVHKGFGTKLLESELKKLFPQAKIARFDGDNTKHDDLASLYDAVKSGEINILIGTQTLARGLDLPHLATVGIVQADAGLALPDFAAEERAFELLTQVIGRVGRGHLDVAEVYIQSYQPDHPVIQTAMQADYAKFAEYLIPRRRKQQMPPFTYLAKLSITYKTERTTLAKIQQAFATLSQNPALTVSPPMPAFHERTARGFTWQLIIKSTSRAALCQALAPFASLSQYSLVLDPPSLL